MKLTVLGSGSWKPRPKNGFANAPLRTPPAFILEHNSHRFLLDCGYGTLLRLEQLAGRLGGPLNALDFDAVCVSHFHGDHAGDVCHFADHYTMLARQAGVKKKLEIYGPVGFKQFYTDQHKLCHCDSLLAENMVKVFERDGLDQSVAFGELHWSSFRTCHETWHSSIGFRFRDFTKSLVYTGDIGPAQGQNFLAGILRADLLLIEAGTNDANNQNHITVEKAVDWARRTGAKQTVLFHIDHERVEDTVRMAKEASEAPGGQEFMVAYDGLQITI